MVGRDSAEASATVRLARDGSAAIRAPTRSDETHRQGFARLELEGTRLPGPGQLERVERIALRELMEASQARPRDDGAEAFVDQGMDGTQAQRAHRDGRRLQADIQLVSSAALGRGAAREQDRDRFIAEPPDGEAHGGRRGAIEPLDVVERDQDR